MIIYKTTNLVNGRFYIGQDSFENPKYLGSGYVLKRAVKKYGRTNFKKETLETCKTKEELNEKEIFWIKKLDATNGLGYNLVDGGQGGNLGEYANKKTSKTLKKYFKDHPELRKGKNNWNHNKEIFHFYNIETCDDIECTKFDLAKKLGSASSAIHGITSKGRKKHKNWIMFEFKEIYTKEFFKEKKSEAAKYARSKAKNKPKKI